MIKAAYAKAYTEVLEIIKYFPKIEYDKIPSEKIEFYENNMDKEYIFTINPEIDLSEQNISPEANAIILNLYTDYFATEEQKSKIIGILNENKQREELEKREKYDPNNIFKKNIQEEKIEESSSKEEVALVEYKETFFKRFINFMKNIFHIG